MVELLVEIEQGMRVIEAARYRVLSVLARHPLYQQDSIRNAAAEVARALRISKCAAGLSGTSHRTVRRE
ncbi:MAG: hypothetical protein ACRDVE_13625 [Actinocrinis sp.]